MANLAILIINITIHHQHKSHDYIIMENKLISSDK